MYLTLITDTTRPTTIVTVQFECCGKTKDWKYSIAKKNFERNNSKHICRSCWLKENNPSHKADVLAKIKKTTYANHGGLLMNTEENIAKRNQKMFGSSEAINEIVNKRKLTNIERYGVDHPMKLDAVKEKQQQVLLDKYGVPVPLKNQHIKEKMQATVKETYGVDNVAKLDEVQDKMRATMMERYGVSHYNKLPEMKNYLATHCKEWLKDVYAAGGWAKGITRSEDFCRKLSDIAAQQILDGRRQYLFSNHFITGHINSNKCKKKPSYFRSSLELAMHWILSNDSDVVSYDVEPFTIEYEKKPGVYRKYIPDFFVIRSNDRPLMIEVKPAFRLQEEAVIAKVQAAQAYGAENDIDFLYADEKYIKANSIPLDQLLIQENVVLLKQKEGSD